MKQEEKGSGKAGRKVGEASAWEEEEGNTDSNMAGENWDTQSGGHRYGASPRTQKVHINFLRATGCRAIGSLHPEAGAGICAASLAILTTQDPLKGDIWHNL